MPNNLTDVNAFTTPVQVPAGSDPRALTYLLTAFQALANRTHYLNKLANDVTERTFVVSPHQAQFQLSNAPSWTRGNSSLTSAANSSPLYLNLDFLPNGAVLKRVRALVTPGANTMTMDVRSRTLDFVTPGSGSDTGVELAITSSGTTLQVLTTSLLSETINRSGGKSYSVVVTSNSAGLSSPDTLWGFQIVADLVGIGAF